MTGSGSTASLDREDWIESHVVDAASIAVSRQHRRAKTDRIDGEALIRTLLAYKRGEPRVCSMVQGAHARRMKIAAVFAASVKRWSPSGFSTSIASRGCSSARVFRGYEPTRRDRRERLEELHTGDGRDSPLSYQGADSAANSTVSSCCSNRSRLSKPSVMRLVAADKADMPAPARCCSASRGSARSSPLSSRPKACSDISTIEGRLQLMPGSLPAPGRAALSIASRVSPKRAIRGFEQRWSNLPGSGCVTSRVRLSARWFQRTGRSVMAGGSRRRRSSRWPASCSSRSGSM